MEALGALAVLASLGLFILSLVVLIKPLPAIGFTSRKRGLLGILGAFVLFIVGGAMMPPSKAPAAAPTERESGQVAAKADKDSPPKAVPVGQTASLKGLELKLVKVAMRESVGGPYANEKASEGGVLIVVTTAVRNATDKPVHAYRLPKIELVGPDGTHYREDAGKTGVYKMEVGDVDSKLWSDLNPHITVKDVHVFEIAKDQFDPDTWHAASGDTMFELKSRKAAR